MCRLLTFALALTLYCAAQDARSPAPPPPAAQNAPDIVCKLWVVVTEKGKVEDPKILRCTGNPEIDRRAVEAVKQWRFEPARKNGRPVRVRGTIDVHFKAPKHYGNEQEPKAIEFNPVSPPSTMPPASQSDVSPK
jgi:TonB family protein